MVYLDADNNLEDVGIDNFLSMARVGSTADVNIVVQFDRNSGNDGRYDDWSTTKRYRVMKDMLPNAANALQDLGELNMADSATLTDFVEWATTTYQADHYFLDLWDHGLGWQGVALDELPVPGDVMSAVELGQALSEVTTYLGRPLDIVANDACRMTLEIMYQIRQYADYLVGSEKDEPVEGWPYDTVLGSLVANPDMTPVQLAKTLVDDYVDSYLSGSSYSVTMALVNASALPQLITSLNSFVSAANFTFPYFVNPVIQSRNNSEHYEGNQCIDRRVGDDYDLYDVASKLKTNVSSGRLVAAATALQSAINKAVLYERHMDLPSAVNCVKARNAHGLSLWYPWSMGPRQRNYEELALSRDSLWDEYLKTYHNSTPVSVSFTASLTGEDRNMDGVLDTARIQYRPSGSGDVYVDSYVDGGQLTNNWRHVSAGQVYQENISLLGPGAYDFYLSLHQTIGMVNATAFTDFLVTAPMTIRGYVRDIYGNTVDGATVTIRNLRTDAVIMNATAHGLYEFSFVYPVWLVSGDRVRLEALKDVRNASFELTVNYDGGGVYWVNLYLEPVTAEPGPAPSFLERYWPLVAFPIAAIVAEIVLIFLMTRRLAAGMRAVRDKNRRRTV